jgi:hypothetical protein
MDRNSIFISYSKKDSTWLSKIKTPLRFLEINNQFNIWDDTKIAISADWNREIENSLRNCKVAILLVSNNFLATEFIQKKEIPVLLKRAEKNGTRIFNVIIDHNVFKMTELCRYQSINNPEKPLCDLSKAEQQKLLVKLAEEVKATVEKGVRSKKESLPDFCNPVIILFSIAKSLQGKSISEIESSTKVARSVIMNCLEQLKELGLIEKTYEKKEAKKKPSTFWKATTQGQEVYKNLNCHLS